MVTNNAPLPNAFTNEEPKHNFCCYKCVQPCVLKHNKQYRNGTYFQLSITSWDRKAFPRLNRNIKDKKYFMDIWNYDKSSQNTTIYSMTFNYMFQPNRPSG